MKSIIPLRQRHFAILACAVLAFPAGVALAGDDPIEGRVRHVHGDILDVCFAEGRRHVVGDTLQLIRHELSSMPKGPVTFKSTSVGKARITALAEGRCASAQLVEGSARSLDWIASQP